MTTPTEVRTPTDHRPEVVTVIAHMRAKPGKEQDLRDHGERRSCKTGCVMRLRRTRLEQSLLRNSPQSTLPSSRSWRRRRLWPPSPNRTKVLGDLLAAPDPATVWETSPDQRRAVVALPGRGKHYADPSRATFRPGGNQDHLEVMTERGT